MLMHDLWREYTGSLSLASFRPRRGKDRSMVSDRVSEYPFLAREGRGDFYRVGCMFRVMRAR